MTSRTTRFPIVVARPATRHHARRRGTARAPSPIGDGLSIPTATVTRPLTRPADHYRCRRSPRHQQTQRHERPACRAGSGGRFEVVVKVTGDFRPDRRVPSERTSLQQRRLAGLPERRQLHPAGTKPDGLRHGTYCFPPLCEIFAEGKYRGISKQPTAEEYFQGRSTWLRIEREGDYFKPAISHDGQTWEELPRVEVILPDRLLVGVAALNTTTTPHTVTFEDLRSH